MPKHYTPQQVAEALAQHCPTSASRVLDPCVGEGALLRAVLQKVDQRAEITAIDVDARAISVFENFVRRTPYNVVCIVQNFFSWLQQNSSVEGGELHYDCVVMNPPFSGKRGMWIDKREIPLRESWASEVPSRLPVEAAFMIAAISLLSDGGIILAILPPSLAAGDLNAWFRRLMCRLGTLSQMHELPKYTFPGIEARMYLCVFRKESCTGDLLLLNHDLMQPKRLQFAMPLEGARLDFAYQSTSRNAERMQRILGADWRPLRLLADVHRGSVTNRAEFSSSIHTSNFSAGFWFPGKPVHRSRDDTGGLMARRGDILVKRVGRDCAQSFGFYLGGAQPCTDCVFIVRSQPDTDTVQLLFLLRCVLRRKLLAALLERGNGATYIGGQALRDLLIPVSLPVILRGIFSEYISAIEAVDFPRMLDLESLAELEIRRACGFSRLD